MTRQLYTLPGGEIGINLGAFLVDLLLHAADFVIKINLQLRVLRVLTQLGELVLQVGNRFLEIEQMFHPLKA